MKKILIIEDHSAMRDLLSWQVQSMGFTPVLAKHGLEGVEKAESEEPQLIIMDIMMPRLDGFQATKQIRSHPNIKHIPILATTALFNDSDLKKCIDAGCNGYIVKPFSFQQLQQKVHELIIQQVLPTEVPPRSPETLD